MTTLFQEQETCAVCGHTATYTAIGSTNRVGSADLDLRPPQMLRATISCWIRRCPACGYCAPAVAEGEQGAAEVVRSQPYLRQLRRADFPALANSFLCWALIEEAAGKPLEAGWASLRAAWASDDARSEAASQECRLRAFNLFERARANGGTLMQDAGGEETVLADLLRRAGQFERARALCEEGLSKEPGEVIKKVLQFQIELAQRADPGCYTVADALGDRA